jgi:transglutaminase-like putative cysteine protease
VDEYLRSTRVIDWQHPAVHALAAELQRPTELETVSAAFEWVRDEIKHSWDFQLNPVTCSASETLAAGTGYCFAKSHLLAAVLRANGIPAGLCYQRLVLDESADESERRFSLHGLNAVYLDGTGWFRIDPRGNKAGVDARFEPPIERLAWSLTSPGEIDVPGVFADPLPEVVNALRSAKDWEHFLEVIPDWQPG